MPVQKAASNRDPTALSDDPWKTNCDDGDDAMLVSVLCDTLPKPTEKIEMPDAFTVLAALIAADEPPPTVCSPSLSSTMARGRFVADARFVWLVVRPAAMFVLPLAE